MSVAFRVSWVDLDRFGDGAPTEKQATPWHPLFVPIASQRHGPLGGRMDNGDDYAALYVADSGVTACGEVFGDLAQITEDDLVRRENPRIRRCLVRLALPDGLRLLDLDDGATLADLGVRPSDVVRRDRERTQQLARLVFLGRDRRPADGLTWWSYHHPAWRPSVIWSNGLDGNRWFPDVAVTDLEPIGPTTAELVIAADHRNVRLPAR